MRCLTIEQLLAAEELPEVVFPDFLEERLTYDQLFRMSEPKRFNRSLTVKMPPLDMQQYQTPTSWNFEYYFNAKGNPSTTGLRHRGYVRFIKPRKTQAGKNTPLSQLPVEVDCMCFSPETPVLMADGTYKPIAAIMPGDQVYSHRGRIRKVIGNVPRPVRKDENVYKIRVTGFPTEIISTGNHPFYTLRGNETCLCGCGKSLFGEDSGQFKLKNRLHSPATLLSKQYLHGHWAKGQKEMSRGAHFDWIKVNEFRSQEWFLSPWLKPGNIKADPRRARLLGYYAAEGHVPERSATVHLTFNTNKAETLAANVLELCQQLGYKTEIKTRRFKKQRWLSVLIRSREFRDFCLRHAGQRSSKKRFSAEVMSWNNQALKETYIGLQLGDGWLYPSRGLRYVTTSFHLATQAATILSRLGIRHTICSHSKPRQNRKKAYRVEIPGTENETRSWLWPQLREKDRIETTETLRHCAYYSMDEGFLCALRKREKIPYTGLVYDLAVEGDESFIVNGIAVHNCPDYRYRWAFANHQRQAGPIGPGSLNQCINKAPKITNPSAAPGLCKHILATRNFIYGQLSGFPKWVGDTERLDKLTKRATRRWLNFDQEMDAARERDAKIAAAKARRNVGLPPEQQNRPIAAIPAALPPELPLEKPVPAAPATKPKPAEKPPGKAAGTPPAPETPGGDFLTRRFMKRESVDNTKTNMKTLNLQEAQGLRKASNIVTEMIDDLEGEDEFPGGAPEPGGFEGPGNGMDEMPPATGGDMPMEPPVSDSAIGASTEDNVALGLLREIRDILAQLAAEESGEQGEAPELPGEGIEPESDGGEGAEEEESEDFQPGKRPMPVTAGAE